MDCVWFDAISTISNSEQLFSVVTIKPIRDFNETATSHSYGIHAQAV